MKHKIQPPAEPKVDLINDILGLAQEKWPNDPRTAIEWFLIFFTGADLVGIRDELRKKK